METVHCFNVLIFLQYSFQVPAIKEYIGSPWSVWRNVLAMKAVNLAQQLLPVKPFLVPEIKASFQRVLVSPRISDARGYMWIVGSLFLSWYLLLVWQITLLAIYFFVCQVLGNSPFFIKSEIWFILELVCGDVPFIIFPAFIFPDLHGFFASAKKSFY